MAMQSKIICNKTVIKRIKSPAVIPPLTTYPDTLLMIGSGGTRDEIPISLKERATSSKEMLILDVMVYEIVILYVLYNILILIKENITTLHFFKKVFVN